MELVIALGICAVTVTSVLALYGPAAQAIAVASDAQAAAQVIGPVQAELQRTPFATIAASVANSETYYASRTGDRVGPYESPVWNSLGPSQRDRDAEKFFAVELLRNDTLPSVPGALVCTLRLRWPAYRADGARTSDQTPKDVLLVPAAIRR